MKKKQFYSTINKQLFDFIFYLITKEKKMEKKDMESYEFSNNVSKEKI